MPIEADQDNAQTHEAVRLLTHTKYMQLYKPLSKVHGDGKTLLPVQNFSGEIELFTTDAGEVWNYYPNSSDPSGTGYSAEKLKFGREVNDKDPLSIAVGTDSENKIVVFTARANQLQYIRENRTGGDQRWEKAVIIDLRNDDDNQLDNQTQILRLYTRNIDRALYVGALIKVEDKKKPGATPVYQFAYSVWSTDPQPFTFTNALLGPAPAVWTGAFESTAAFVMLKEGVRAEYNISKKEWSIGQYHKAIGEVSDVRLLAAVGGETFSITQDGKLCILDREGNDERRWRIISNGDYDFLQAIMDNKRVIYLFMRATNNTIFYCRSIDAGLNWSAPVMLAAGIENIVVTQNKLGNQIIVYLVSNDYKKTGAITKKIYQPSTRNWQTHSLVLPAKITEDIIEFFGYSTDVRVTDENDGPLAKFDIRITSSTETQIIVNNQLYLIDHDKEAAVATDSTGMLTIVQPAEILGAAAALQLKSPASHKQYGLRQWEATVLPKLEAVTAESLKNQKLADGMYLLPEKFRENDKKVAELADNIAACVDLIKKYDVALIADDHSGQQKQYQPGFGVIPPGSAMRLKRIAAATDFSQESYFSSLAPEIQSIPDTSQLYKKTVIETWDDSFLADTENNRNTKLWLKEKAELIISGTNHILDFVGTIQKTVNETIEVAGKFIIKTVNDAFNAVQAFFSSAGVTVEKIHQWLGFVFDWDDILRTKNALVHAIDQMLALSERAIDRIEQVAVKQFAEFKNKIDERFDQLKAQFPDKLEQTFYQQNSQENPQASEAASNNFLYRALLDKSENATIENPPVADSETQDRLVQTMKKLEKGDDLYAKSINVLGSPEDMYNLALPKLLDFLRMTASGALNGLEAVTTTLLEVIRGSISSFNALLNAEWNIPFVRSLYRHLTGETKLNVKHLIALVIAIPTTAVWKVIRGTAIFKDDDELNEFKSGFIWENMIGFLSEADHPAEQIRHRRTVESTEKWEKFKKKWGALLAYLSGHAGGISSIFSGVGAIIDSKLFAAINVAAFSLSVINFTSGKWGDLALSLSLTALLLDVAVIFFPALGEISPLATTGLGIVLLFTYAMGIAAGEISKTTDMIIAGCYPLIASFSFLTFKLVKAVIPPPPMTAPAIFAVIAGGLGVASTIAASSALVDSLSH